MTRLRLIFGPLACATLAMLATAQMPNPATPPHSATHHIIPAFGFGPAGVIISPKLNSPFSGVMLEHSEQILSDGTTINRDNEETVMRDSAGRIYRARQIKMAGRPDARPRMMVTIIDSVQHIQYLCSPAKVCRKMPYHQPPDRSRLRAPDVRKMPNITVEDLGASNISGIDVHGERIIRVIPEGEIGNDHPLSNMQETWRSDELGIDVQVRRSDPRAGNRTTTLTELNLAEPNPANFQVPAGYRLADGPMTTSTLELEPFPPDSGPNFQPLPPLH